MSLPMAVTVHALFDGMVSFGSLGPCEVEAILGDVLIEEFGHLFWSFFLGDVRAVVRNECWSDSWKIVVLGW